MYTQEDVKKVQKRLLEMAIVIRDILELNNIPYFLSSGSLLGAVRHKGFIPWDDDLDFYLFADSYPEAMAVLREKLPNSMFLENEESEPKYFHDWAHVKDINTECECALFPQDSMYSHKGLSIDLYKMSKLPQCGWPEFKFDQAIRYINKRKEFDFISDEEYNHLSKVFKEKYETQQKTVPMDNKLIFGSSVSKHIFKYDDILPLGEISFEGHKFKAPNSPHGFLTEIYGDYMTLPPIEKRIPHMSSVVFK